MTAFGDVEKAVDAMRGGACDFLMKPFEPQALIEHVRRYAAPDRELGNMVASDLHTRNLLALAAKVAETDATVLLTCKVTLTGFIISDHPEHFPAAWADLADRVASGKLVWRRTITEGLENAPAAFIGMLGGANTGKALVRVS